jgi:hypothetical protein
MKALIAVGITIALGYLVFAATAVSRIEIHY